MKQLIHNWGASVLTAVVMLLSILLESKSIRVVRLSGALLGLPILIFAFFPMFTMKKYGRTEEDGNYMNTTKVVDKGIFAVIRHPQYFAYILLNVVFMLLSGQPAVFITGAATIIFFYFHMINEEKIMIEQFGDDYKEYMIKVPRMNVIWGIVLLAGRSRKADDN